MRLPLAAFDPSASTSGSVNIAALPGGQGTLIIYNDSGYTLRFSYGNAYQHTVLAGMVDLICLSQAGYNAITWQQVTVLSNVGAWPVSQVYVEGLTPDERVSGTYPFAIPRVQNSFSSATNFAQPPANGGSLYLKHASLVGQLYTLSYPTVILADFMDYAVNTITTSITANYPDYIESSAAYSYSVSGTATTASATAQGSLTINGYAYNSFDKAFTNYEIVAVLQSGANLYTSADLSSNALAYSAGYANFRNNGSAVLINVGGTYCIMRVKAVVGASTTQWYYAAAAGSSLPALPALPASASYTGANTPPLSAVWYLSGAYAGGGTGTFASTGVPPVLQINTP